jgi:branched-chain amino acid aminotransferase
MGMFEAYNQGYKTAVLVDEKNNILEGPGFNIFSLDKDGLHTPSKGVLMGITREAIIQLANELNMPINFSSISLDKIRCSYEVFATSTAGGIMPITKINNFKIGTGTMGIFTKKIYKKYWDKHFDNKWSVLVKDLLL